MERAELAENKLKSIAGELETVGQNMKQLEKSAEKALAGEGGEVGGVDLQLAGQVQVNGGKV